jgi:hypothetical protein
LLPSKPGENRDPQPIRALTNQLSELEKLQDNRLITQEIVISNQWNRSIWSQNWFIETESQFGDYVLGVVSKHAPNFLK